MTIGVAVATISGHLIATEKHVERIRKQELGERETTGAPLCCTRARQKTTSLPNECSFLFSLLFMLICWQVGIDIKSNFSQC